MQIFLFVIKPLDIDHLSALHVFDFRYVAAFRVFDTEAIKWDFRGRKSRPNFGLFRPLVKLRETWAKYPSALNTFNLRPNI